ncbi:MAG: hypothetical protein FJW35_13000 [Acidobacteria bacterium]|nr:hypothetical protein [Acidobacteriota bacterium]
MNGARRAPAVLMNSRERIAAAMRHGPVDRVPVMCQLTLGHYFLNTRSPEIDIWHSTEEFCEALIALQRQYCFDGILVNLPGRDPAWRSYIRKIDRRGREKVLRWTNGWQTICPPDDNPHVLREDGRPFAAKFTEIDPDRLFYVDLHDIGGLKYPPAWGLSQEPADPENFFPPWHFDTIDCVVGRVGGEVSVHGEVFSPFTQFLELLGYEEGLMALLDNPAKSRACLEALARGAIALGRGLAAHGVDAILISSAFAGAGFISPDHYREFVLPYERTVVRGVRETAGIPLYTHTCGSIGDRLECIAETGTGGIDTLDPPPLGNVDLADAKRRIGEKLFIKGNLDPVNIVLKGTPELVYESAVRCLEAGAPGGGYILSSACSVPPHAPPANILKLSEAAADFGSP